MHRGGHGHGGFPKPRSCSPHRPRTPPSDPAVPAAGIASAGPSAPAPGETPPPRGRTGRTAQAESRGQAACEPSTPPYLGGRRYAERARLRERADRQSRPRRQATLAAVYTRILTAADIVRPWLHPETKFRWPWPTTTRAAPPSPAGRSFFKSDLGLEILFRMYWPGLQARHAQAAQSSSNSLLAHSDRPSAGDLLA
jgi:hypothetical protein